MSPVVTVEYLVKKATAEKEAELTRLRAEVEALRAAFQPIDADTGWAVICPEVGGIVYSTLDKECTPAFARDLCMEHIKNAMQEPELRSTARRWTVRRIWIARAALSQEAKP